MAPSVTLMSPAVGTENVGDQFIELAVRRLLPPDAKVECVSTRVPLSSQQIEKANSTSVILVCGSNLYQEDWQAPALEPATLARLRVPVVPLGVGSSAAELEHKKLSRRAARRIRILHDACPVASVRDPHTLAILERLRIDNAVVTGCPVYHWAGCDELPVIDSRPRPRVVVTARNWLMHREPHAVNHPVQIAFLERVLDGIDGDVVFAIHEPFDRELIHKLGVSSSVLDSRDVADYVSTYSDANNVVLGMRLHAGMLAVANAVPAVFIGHDTRTYSFCAMAGLPVIKLFDEDAAQRTVQRLRDLMRGDVSEARPDPRSYKRLRSAMTSFLSTYGLH